MNEVTLKLTPDMALALFGRPNEEVNSAEEAKDYFIFKARFLAGMMGFQSVYLGKGEGKILTVVFKDYDKDKHDAFIESCAKEEEQADGDTPVHYN